MPQNYEPEFKKKIVWLHMEQGRTYKSITEEYGVSKDSISKRCTDFTYLFLTDGSKRYNCSILDLHDRSVIASITDKNITADLAIRTLKKALESQKSISPDLILHSDQGSMYTSKDFIEFCASSGIRQSMSKARYPYDNAPMERYYNTLKSELTYPHSYNGYKTPFEARYAAAK